MDGLNNDVSKNEKIKNDLNGSIENGRIKNDLYGSIGNGR
jgi:hypothetical protein